MVKMLDTFRESPMNRTWLGLLYADSKEDISGEFEVEGLPTDYEIEWGSEIITAAGDIGQLNSEGTWVWVGNEDTRSSAKSTEAPALKTSIDDLKKTDLEDEKDIYDLEPDEEEVYYEEDPIVDE